MEREFGEEYVAYKRQTSMFLPLRFGKREAPASQLG